MKDNFWKGKKVLITGYEGFLGSWLTKFLLARGADIIGLDIVTRRRDTILTKNELAGIKIIKGSVSNFPLVSKIIKTDNPEFVFHLAAKSLVGDCLNNPREAFSTNVKGTWNILEASRRSRSIKGIIIASSDKAYGSHKTLPYEETFFLCGIHPYDVSKSCADLIANSYFRTYGSPVCVTRCGNIFGPGDFNFSRIIPATVRSAFEKKKLVIRSDGKFVRDYIYVKDIVGGYLTLGEEMAKSKILGEAFNFSGEKPLSVLEMVKAVYRRIGVKPDYKILNQAQYEIKEQYLSTAKAKKMLGWKPKYSLDDSLEETIDWYRAYLGG